MASGSRDPGAKGGLATGSRMGLATRRREPVAKGGLATRRQQPGAEGVHRTTAAGLAAVVLYIIVKKEN